MNTIITALVWGLGIYVAVKVMDIVAMAIIF
jgi:hypothetical protein